MRTSIVNGLVTLALAASATGSAIACSNADGRPRAAGQPPADSLTAKADIGRIDGAATAKVWVVEISDFQCPYCKEWHDASYEKLRSEFVKTGKVRFAFVNFPLAQHRNARAAATAAMCASVQGKFWPMHTALFTSQEQWEATPNPAAQFESLAQKAGVDLAPWRACLSAKPVQSLINADMDRAKRAGVQATPSFLVGGRLLEGVVPVDELRKAINEALAGTPAPAAKR